MSDLNLPKLFNHELNSIYQSKPPVSRAKMASITKQALNAVKYYKHVVIAVEKFIAKCRPEYKLPGLYVIDSIVRQSQYQHGNKDVYGPRFSKNFSSTFEHLFQCREEDRPKIVRVLNLWQKNDIYPPDVIQPLMKLASENQVGFGTESGSSRSFNHSQPTQPELTKPASSFPHQPAGARGQELVGSKASSDVKVDTDAALIIEQQQRKIEELMQQQQQLIQAQALQSLLGQNPVLAAAAAAVAVKDKADNSIVSLLQEQQNQLNQLETLKNQLSGQFEPPPEPAPPKPYKEPPLSGGHPTEFNKALLDDFDYSDEEEDMSQRIQRQRDQVEQQQTRLQQSPSATDVDMLAQLQQQFRRNEHDHMLTAGGSDVGRMNDDVNSVGDFHVMPPMPMMQPPPHHQPPPLPHHRLHEPPPPHLPPQPRRSRSPEPFPPLPSHHRNQPPPPPHFENNFPPPPQQRHDNMYPMPPPPVHRGGGGFHDNHHSPPTRFNDDPFYHGDHRRFSSRERRRSRSPIPPPVGRSRSPLPPPARGRSRSPLPPHRGRSRSPPRGRSRSPPPSGRPRRWDRDSRGGRRSRSPRSRSPPPMQHHQPPQQPRGYPHNVWEPTQPQLELPPQPPPPPPSKFEWKGREIPSPKSQRYTICSTTIWVGRLPKGITKLQLEEAFSDYGPLNSVELVVQRGCAYVCMVHRADTVRARNGLMNTKIGGSYCKLAWAPGKGVKGPNFKSYWSPDDGASFIPWDLVKEEGLAELAAGGMIDPDSYPPGVKPLPPPKPKEDAASLPPQDPSHSVNQDSVVAAPPPVTTIAAPPIQQPNRAMAPPLTNVLPPPILPPQQAHSFPPPPMHMPPPRAPMNMIPPPGRPFGATPPPVSMQGPPPHLQGPPPPLGGPPPAMRPPFSHPGPPQQFSQNFNSGHQLDMQFGRPQMGIQRLPPGGGPQLEMMNQPPPTIVPPVQMNSGLPSSAMVNENQPPPDKPGEHQIEPEQVEQDKEQKNESLNESLVKPDESSTEASGGDKMDICDMWEQEKQQRLAEEVEKFEQEVMNIEKSNSKTSTDNAPIEATADTNKAAGETLAKQDEKILSETKVEDTAGAGGSEQTRQVIDSEVESITKVKNTEGTSEEVTKLSGSAETDEHEDIKTENTTDDNRVPSDQTILEPNNMSKGEQKPLGEEEHAQQSESLAETNTALCDDAMDIQDSSSETNEAPSQLLTATEDT